MRIKIKFIRLYSLSNSLIEWQLYFQVSVYMQHVMHEVLKRSVTIAQETQQLHWEEKICLVIQSLFVKIFV